MLVKRDSLGRRVPTFNRSEAQKKVANERKKNDPTYYSRIGTNGGRSSHNGGFHILKAEDPEKFMEISRKAAEASKIARKNRPQKPKTSTGKNKPSIHRGSAK